MHRVCSLTFFLAACLASCAGARLAAEELYRDDFSLDRGRLEQHGGNVWAIGDGRCRFSAPGAERFIVVNLDEPRHLRVEASLTVARRLDGGYATAGLTLFADPENNWRLVLVAGPADRRYFELVQRHQGVHQAQNMPPPARTMLAGRREGNLPGWEYGQEYRLALSITPESIIGEVRTADGLRFWRATYAFADAHAVRSGSPGITASGFEGLARSLVVEGQRAGAPDLLSVPAGKLGAAAIVADEAGRIAPVLQRLLDKEGFGTRILSWDEVGSQRLSAEKVDLLVLADARRVPVSVARAAVAFLRSRGKLIAVGAPAFAELLWRIPQGYVSAERYAETVYDGLAKRPMPVEPGAWQRAAMKPAKKSTLALDPAAAREPGGASGQVWKATVDLEGWDSFIHRPAQGFGGGNSLLCFRAKGDTNTSQLAIECNEKDGSRWIAMVELTPQWRKYILWPGDFLYWVDSPAKRGGPGDRFHPAAAATVQFALSMSHTPRCQAGPHSFWIADLATAPEIKVDRPEVQLPDIEGLYPSHKLYPMEGTVTLRAPHLLGENASALRVTTQWLSPVWRETGIGYDRSRPWRWLRLVETQDSSQRDRGPIVSLMLGESVFPGAMWLNVGLADPVELVEGRLSEAILPVVAKTAVAMNQGCFLLEGGSRHFSYPPEEPVELGALVMNAGRGEQRLMAKIVLADETGVLAEHSESITVGPGERRQVAAKRTLSRKPHAESRCEVRATIASTPGFHLLDSISHRIDLRPDKPADPGEYVKVQGSRFMLGGQPWYMLGVNYRPTSQGGRPTLEMFRRDLYDPEIIERDLAWMESIGINMISAIYAPVPENPRAPGAHRDLHDFLDRCRRHKIKVFYFLNHANPLAGGRFEAIRKHIDAARIKDHPAILAWELSWEPIYYSGPASGQMDFLVPAWNEWIIERYGSIEEAERDWGYKLPHTALTPGPSPETGEGSKNTVGLPDPQWCSKHGPWDRVTAAFRRFFSDHVGSQYGRIIRQLRNYDPKHLVTFRFGACGIPNQAWFAHAHSAGVAKHVDFLCPEGYNLQSGGWAKATPPDDLRKGGLVTLYYRFLSREKPVVWMEFGYTVNSFQTPWKAGRERIAPAELATQRAEYESFYSMFLESGARGAAPWWLPGGFRADERSDFGILEPDGSERPACQVLRRRLPDFAKVPVESCVAPACERPRNDRPAITLDLDAHYADAWDFYAPKYLESVKSGRVPCLRSAGTGTTSADCPLVAVGNTPLNGRNPPQFLNAEFNRIEYKSDEADPWREVSGDTIAVKKGATLRCRVSVGNTGEAAWIAPPADRSSVVGGVYLRCGGLASARTVDVPISKATAYLSDAEPLEFALPLSDESAQTVALGMVVTRMEGGAHRLTIPFGQKRTIRVRVM